MGCKSTCEPFGALTASTASFPRWVYQCKGGFQTNTCREVESFLVSSFGYVVVRRLCQYQPSAHLWTTVFSTLCCSFSVLELCVLLFKLLKGSATVHFSQACCCRQLVYGWDFFVVQDPKEWLHSSRACQRKCATDGCVIAVVSLCTFNAFWRFCFAFSSSPPFFFSLRDGISFKLLFFLSLSPASLSKAA